MGEFLLFHGVVYTGGRGGGLGGLGVLGGLVILVFLVVLVFLDRLGVLEGGGKRRGLRGVCKDCVGRV